MKVQPLLRWAGVDYGPYVKAFDELWACIEKHGGWGEETLRQCKSNVHIRQAMGALHMGPVTLPGLTNLVKTDEFEAYRRDVTYLRCLAAEKRSHDKLPDLIADHVVREHAYEAGQRRTAMVKDENERLVAEALDDADIDGDDIAAMLDGIGAVVDRGDE